MDTGLNPSTALATVLVDELVAGGVTDAVLCPGSRSAPLSMALHAADAAGRVRLHVRLDERTAGFLALGLARSSGRPVPVATTSGTAVANLHPAVLEAHHGGVPLLVLSADRPPRLRDVGANQTIAQTELFGPALRWLHEFDAPARAAGQNARWRSLVCRALAHAGGAGTGVPGPVQLNLPFDEPLLPAGTGVTDTPDWPEPLTGRAGPWTEIAGPSPSGPPIAAPAAGERCLFVADLTHPAAETLAAAGHPVVSEAGGAAGAHVLAAGVHLLADPAFLSAHRPDRVVVLGRPTLFRSVLALLGDPGSDVDVVAAPAAYADVPGTVRRVAGALDAVGPAADSAWLRAWRQADTAARAAVDAVLDGRDVDCSIRLARDLTATLADGTTLVVGSSQPPRDLALGAAPRGGVRVLANRGVAGIDGLVSTSIGAALAADGPTVALLGDLTLLHDTTGLVIGPHEPRPDLTIVVSHNDGGAIFATLEPGEAAHAAAFERVFGTAHGVGFAPLAAAVGAEHVLVTGAAELADAVRAPRGIRIVEVPTDRVRLRDTLAEIRQAVSAALS